MTTTTQASSRTRPYTGAEYLESLRDGVAHEDRPLICPKLLAQQGLRELAIDSFLCGRRGLFAMKVLPVKLTQNSSYGIPSNVAMFFRSVPSGWRRSSRGRNR